MRPNRRKTREHRTISVRNPAFFAKRQSSTAYDVCKRRFLLKKLDLHHNMLYHNPVVSGQATFFCGEVRYEMYVLRLSRKQSRRQQT